MATAIEFNNISKLYRLGMVGTGTLAHDMKRWWTMNIRGKEDPYLTIGETNDRSSKGTSDYVWALKDIDFKVEQGDVVGIIGKNGAGKSTLLKILSKVTAPTTGTIRARGRIGSLLEVGTGFHPEMTGRENIYMNGAILGMTKAEITKKLDEIVDFSGCERYIDTPVKRYSSGMMVRLGFSVAAHLDPEILVVDEVLAVGDAEFQKKAIGKMQDVSKGEGRTVLFVSHNMASIKALCRHGVLLENGRVKCAGNMENVIDQYISQSDLSIRKRNWEVNDSKPACITGIEIQVEGKRTDQLIDMNDRIKIVVEYYIKEPLKGSNISFVLYKDAIPLFSTWDVDSSPELLNYREKGYHRTEFYLTNNLKPGIYDMRIDIGIPNRGTIDLKESPLQFEIRNILTEGSRKSFTRTGLFQFSIKWTDTNI